MNHIIEKLYVGDMNDARILRNTRHKDEPRWGTVISVMQYNEPGQSPINYQILTLESWPYNVNHYHLDMTMLDVVASYLRGTQEFLDLPVLVHCAYGQERSPAVCMRYLILYHGMTLPQAAAYVKERNTETIHHPEWWPPELTKEE